MLDAIKSFGLQVKDDAVCIFTAVKENGVSALKFEDEKVKNAGLRMLTVLGMTLSTVYTLVQLGSIPSEPFSSLIKAVFGGVATVVAYDIFNMILNSEKKKEDSMEGTILKPVYGFFADKFKSKSA